MHISLGAIEYQKSREQAKGLRVARKFALALTTVTLAAVFLGTSAGPASDANNALLQDGPRAAEVMSQAPIESPAEPEPIRATLPEGSSPTDISAGSISFAK